MSCCLAITFFGHALRQITLRHRNTLFGALAAPVIPYNQIAIGAELQFLNLKAFDGYIDWLHLGIAGWTKHLFYLIPQAAKTFT
jgi:hypothetical protein